MLHFIIIMPQQIETEKITSVVILYITNVVVHMFNQKI